MSSKKYNSGIVKWPGGKKRELNIILKNVPSNINFYYEPFVGGGSVFLNIPAKHYYINDISKDLYNLYINIKSSKCRAAVVWWVEFFHILWKRTEAITQYTSILFNICKAAYSNLNDDDTNFNRIYETLIKLGLGDIDYLDYFTTREHLLCKSTENIITKLKKLKKIEENASEDSIRNAIECGIKTTIYEIVRDEYNKYNGEYTSIRHVVLFLFLRTYVINGMFRYNKNGGFNAPYGGIGYNSVSLYPKKHYYNNIIAPYLENTDIFNKDFREFIQLNTYSENDFIFLDPPYDSEFSTYDNVQFGQKEHQDLAEILADIKCKWMLVIKKTDFIISLYKDKPNIYIQEFDKKYSVNFKNRNNRECTHLLITNYKISKSC